MSANAYRYTFMRVLLRMNYECPCQFRARCEGDGHTPVAGLQLLETHVREELLGDGDVPIVDVPSGRRAASAKPGHL